MRIDVINYGLNSIPKLPNLVFLTMLENGYTIYFMWKNWRISIMSSSMHSLLLIGYKNSTWWNWNASTHDWKTVGLCFQGGYQFRIICVGIIWSHSISTIFLIHRWIYACFYLFYQVLHIDEASQVTFKMFSVITALCERVTNME